MKQSRTRARMPGVAGTVNVGNFAAALGFRTQKSALIQELKAGPKDAYAWLVGEFHQPVYSLVYRILTDPADAADTTQDVFVKVFRGMKSFHGQSSLKTWIYRIAIHEASNRRRGWFRHKSKETPVEQTASGPEYRWPSEFSAALMDRQKSPFETVADHEVQARVEQELRNVPEPYRTALVLRDIEDLSYEQIAEITQVSLRKVKSRITRGRDALRKLLADYIRDVGPELSWLSLGQFGAGDVSARRTIPQAIGEDLSCLARRNCHGFAEGGSLGGRSAATSFEKRLRAF